MTLSGHKTQGTFNARGARMGLLHPVAHMKKKIKKTHKSHWLPCLSACVARAACPGEVGVGAWYQGPWMSSWRGSQSWPVHVGARLAL